MSELIEIGRLAGAFSLRGEIKFVSFLDPAEEAFLYKEWQNASGKHIFKVKKWRSITGGFAVSFEGIPDRTAAERFAKESVYITRSALAPLDDEDTFYPADLFNMAVHLKSTDQILGTVFAVQNFGASDILEIALNGDETNTVMVPFTKEAVPLLNLEQGKITVEDAFITPLLPKGFEIKNL
jgi:16S rRNA processing protein RimM